MLRLLPLEPYEESCLRKPVDSNEVLVARTAVVAGDIWEMPGLFGNVRQSLRRRCVMPASLLVATRELLTMDLEVLNHDQMTIVTFECYVSLWRVECCESRSLPRNLTMAENYEVHPQ
ncbi:hypothetical protein TNCV_4937831 [Trichonephila clavipes]|nr:hypothetical protein TNCV_4937831 [Trichonephila clavipes]